MAFQFSDTANKNKVFLVKRSELEGRLDTVFYKPEYRENEQSIRNSVWGFDTVRHIANRIADGPFGSDLKAEEYQPGGIPLLRVSNLKTGAVEGDIVFISDEKHRQLKRSTVYPNDVVLTKAGAILGYSAVFPESLGEGNITSHLVTITCREDVDPYYLSWFFRSNIGQLQIYRWGNKSTRPELNTGEVEKILVPLPSAEIQRQIVDQMNDALAAKKQKEAQAQQQLDSIDTYLLYELGIELPQEEENNISQRMFVRKSSEVRGGRFDAYFYKMKFIELSRKISDSKYIASQLGKVCNRITNGFDNRDFSITGLPYVKVANIRPYQITPDIFQCINIDTPDRVSLAENDILLTRKGSFGMAARVTSFIDYAICSEIFKIRLNNVKNAPYIEAILNSQICQIQFDQLKIGAIMGSLTQDVIKKVLIPLPPLEKQNEIAAHIQTIRDQAKQLRSEAAAGLEQAKRKVEAMIIGN